MKKKEKRKKKKEKIHEESSEMNYPYELFVVAGGL